jgi:hypothetical protein
MSSVVNGDKIKSYEEDITNEYKKDNGKWDRDEIDDKLAKYMEGLEGVQSVKKVKGNKIVYIDSEGKKQKVDKEQYI